MNYLIRHLTGILFISSFFILSFYYSVGTANAAAVIDATPYGLTRIYYANGIADLQADQEIMSVDTLLSRWVVERGSSLAASNYSIISSTATPSSSDGFFGYLVLQVKRNDDNSTFTDYQQYGSGEYNLTHTYTCPSGYNHAKADGSAGDSHDAYCAIADTCSSKSGQSVYASVSYSNAPTQICVSSCLATRKVSVSFGDLPSSTTLWQGMTFKYTGASCSGDSNTAGQEYKTQAEADALNATAKQQAAYTAAVTKCGGADYVSTGTVNGATTYTCKSTDSKTNSSTTTTATANNSDGTTTTTTSTTSNTTTSSSGGGSGYTSGTGTTTTTSTTTNPTTGASTTTTETETTGSGSGTGITANYDTALNDWDSKNFGTVMQSHVDSLKSSPIYTGLTSFTDVSISGNCSPIVFSVMGMEASFDICSALDSFLTIVSAVVIFLASWFAFRIVQE